MSFMKRMRSGSVKLALTVAMAMGAAAVLCGSAKAINDPIATWTFETNPPGGAGCATNPACPAGTDYPVSPFPTQSADSGTGTALGHHAASATVWSNPVGNGSNESFSSNNWAVGDYYQFQVSTSGLSNIGLQLEQTGSNTGPRDFKVQYSTNGTTFTDFGTYSTSGLSWSSVAPLSPPEQDTFAFSLNSISAVNNQPNLYIRLTDASTTSNNGGTVAAGGTSRVDNVNIYSNFDITQPPIIGPPTPPVLPQGNDVVLGLGNSQPRATLDLVRGPATANGGLRTSTYSGWQSTPFVQYVSFDNLGGTAHNVAGNLLGVDVGTFSSSTGVITGGTIYNLATTGSLPFANTQNLATLPGSRVGQIAVSPGNNKVAVAGTDSGQVTVWDYTPGNSQGAGGSLTGLRSTSSTPLAPSVQIPPSGSTTTYSYTQQAQGVTWINDNTVLSLSSAGNLVETNATTMATTAKGSVSPAPPALASASTDLEYNPAISPYVWALYGGFNPALGNSINTLYILDPANNYSLIHSVDLSGTTVGGVTTPSGAVPTADSLAFDAAGDLFIAGNGSVVSVIPNAAATAATIPNLSALQWYKSGTFASFVGMDIGLAATTPPGVQGDYNGDGKVNAADYVVWRDAVGGSTLLNRGTGITGNVGTADYAFWKAHFGNTSGSGAGLGVSAVPEPASALLMLLGFVAIGCCKRRS